MTRSSQTVRDHILDFDDNFERTLRRKRHQQASNPPSLEPEFEEQEVCGREQPHDIGFGGSPRHGSG